MVLTDWCPFYSPRGGFLLKSYVNTVDFAEKDLAKVSNSSCFQIAEGIPKEQKSR